MGLAEEQIQEYIACRELDTFCTKIDYHPLKIVFDLNQIMYPSRTDMLVYMLWLIVYNNNKTYFIVENSLKQCVYTMGQFYALADKLPFWMQPEPIRMRATYVDFTNGCKLQVICNSANLRGWSISGAMISTNISNKKASELRAVLAPSIMDGRLIFEFNNGAEYEWEN